MRLLLESTSESFKASSDMFFSLSFILFTLFLSLQSLNSSLVCISEQRMAPADCFCYCFALPLEARVL